MTVAQIRTPRRRRTFLLMAALMAVIAGISGSLMLNRSESRADASAINFESPTYSAGNINAQDGWSKTNAAFDVAVVANTYGYGTLGSQVLRVSNSFTSGSFGDQTFSKPLGNEAGEFLATNGGLSTGPRQNHFDVSWDIATAKTVQQPGLSVSFSPDRGDGARMSYLRVEDQPAGLTVYFDDVQGTTNPANFVETAVATGLNRTSVHRLRLVMDFLAGPSNDVVQVYVDGILKHTGTSWENYFRYDSEASADQHTHTVDSLLIRTGGTAVPANAGFGYIIDNINETTSTNPAPPSTTTVVRSADLNPSTGWTFYNDENDTIDNTPGVLGSFVAGPGTAPLGTGSAQISVSGTQRRNLATYQFAGTSLANITELKFSLYNNAATNLTGNPNTSAFLVMNVDFTGTTDTWQKRLVFVPPGTPQTAWKERDAIQGGLAQWSYSGASWPVPGTGAACVSSCVAGTTLKTWNQVLADYPNIRIRVTDAHVGIRVGNPDAAGYTENIDKFVFSTSAAQKIFNFEPNNTCTTTCYVRTTGNNLNDGATPATAKLTIQNAIDTVNPGGTVDVGPGTFNEDVNVNKAGVTVKGAGYASTTVIGPIGGAGSTFTAAAAGVIIDGFTITRAGNNTTDWNNAGLNTAGVAVQGQGLTVELRNSKVTGMRTAVDINNSNGNNIHDNIIDNNRTGLILRNQTDNTQVKNNFITNNWTVGVLFLDASGGTNSPVQTAAASFFNLNNISGNWYGQVVDRQTGGSLPAPGANLKNFENNWWGTMTPAVTVANSTEPGYSAQIPVIYGGSAVAPGGQPDITGLASANIDHDPLLCSGTDISAAVGFQPLLACGDIQVTSAAATTGQTNVQVQVRANNVVNLFGTQTYLTYDAARLTLTGVTLGTGLNPEFIALNTTGPGLISFSYSQVSSAPVTGSNIVLATLTFTATAPGAAVIGYQVGPTQLFSNNLGQPEGPLNKLTGTITITGPVFGTGEVTGTIILQGRTSNAGATAGINPVLITDTGSPSATTDAFGNYTIVGVDEGIVDLRARMVGYLLGETTVNVVANASNPAGSVTLLGGDANMDGTINILDLSLVASYFGQGPSYVPVLAANTTADINGDGIVNILDLSLTAANYGAVGPIPF